MSHKNHHRGKEHGRYNVKERSEGPRIRNPKKGARQKISIRDVNVVRKQEDYEDMMYADDTFPDEEEMRLVEHTPVF